MESNEEKNSKTFPALLASLFGDLYDHVDAPEDKATLDSFSEELQESADLRIEDLQASDIAKISEVVSRAVDWLGNLVSKTEDASSEKALIRVVNLLKSLPTCPKTEEKSNSKEEVQKMSEEPNVEFEKVREDLANAVSEVEELKNSLIEKDKELSALKDDFSKVTEAKDTAEAELANIAQEKKDTELLGYIEREVKLSITDDEDEAKDSRLESLRKLNDEALEVYTGMLSFQEKAAENASATRKTLEEDDEDDEKKETSNELKAQLEAAFGIKKKE